MLNLSIKYLPRTDQIYNSLQHLSRMIKKLPGVKSVTIETFNKKRILITINVR